jgi:hypothetical protein
VSPRRGVGGPGRSGGLLFLGVLVFVLYLALTALSGALRVLAAGALVLGIAGLAADVRRRR